MMNPIDLKDFADHSQKLPGKFLAPKAQKLKTETVKILFSHMIDFGLAFAVTSLLPAMFNQSVKMMMVTRGLKSAFSENAIFSLSASTLPLVLFSYFFFSYFFNHGQTAGMMMMKRRVEMKSKSFMEAFKWALHSSFLCISGGLSFALTRPQWKGFKNQDYLYSQMMIEKDVQVINLLNEIDKIESQKVSDQDVEEDYAQAA